MDGNLAMASHIVHSSEEQHNNLFESLLHDKIEELAVENGIKIQKIEEENDNYFAFAKSLIELEKQVYY